MKEFTKRETKGANISRQLCAKLLYSSNVDFKWMIPNNHTKNCDVMVRDLDVAQEVWGKDIDVL